MSRLVIQLARLGDLVQTLPTIMALTAAAPEEPLDLLCSEPLVALATRFPGLGRVLPWDGPRWARWAVAWPERRTEIVAEMLAHVQAYGTRRYETAYNLNQHPRAIVAAHLFASRVRGPGAGGVLARELPPWTQYLQAVATHRGANRIHLSDAWCGTCGVRPLGTVPRIAASDETLPSDLERFKEGGECRVALIVGAGDRERAVPPRVWAEWATAFLAANDGRLVLVGTAGERAIGAAVEEALAPLHRARLWDATGRTTLTQLALLLSGCDWVVGPDTGALHLGWAVGARVMGWYTARARVHETGPYGNGHWVWQVEAEPPPGTGSRLPRSWPIAHSVALLLNGARGSCPGWSLWESHLDRWGAYYTNDVDAGGATPDTRRQTVWAQLDPVLAGGPP